MDDIKKYLQNNRAELDTEAPGEDVWNTVSNRMKQEVNQDAVRTIPVSRVWMIAAAIAVIMGTAMLIFLQNRPAGTASQFAQGGANKTPTLRSRSASLEQIASTKVQDKLHPTELPGPAPTNETATSTEAEQATKTAARADMPRKPQAPVKKRTLYGFENIESDYMQVVNHQLSQIRRLPIYAEDASYFAVFKQQLGELSVAETELKQQVRKGGLSPDVLDELILIYQRKVNLLKQLQFEINKMNNKVKPMGSGAPAAKPSYINL